MMMVGLRLDITKWFKNTCGEASDFGFTGSKSPEILDFKYVVQY